MNLDELYSTRKYLINSIDNFMKQQEKHALVELWVHTDRHLQDLVDRLYIIEEEIKNKI